MSKRSFLGLAAAGTASLLVAACGGGGDEGNENADVVVLDNQLDETYVPGSEGEGFVPLSDPLDLLIDPNGLVPGPITGEVSRHGQPLAGATVTVYSDSGELIAQGTTATDGRYEITGQARAAMHTVVQTPEGELSSYLLSVVQDDSYVDELNTLVDRLRSASGWTISQATARMQDFLSIPRMLDLQSPMEFSETFTFPAFERARAYSELSEDEFINEIVAVAQDPQYAGYVLWYPPAVAGHRNAVQATATKADKNASFLDPLLAEFTGGLLTVARISSGFNAVSGAYSVINKALNLMFSDDEKRELAGGWFLKLGLVSIDENAIKLTEILDETLRIKQEIIDVKQMLNRLKLDIAWDKLDDSVKIINRFEKLMGDIKETAKSVKAGTTSNDEGQKAVDNLLAKEMIPNGLFVLADQKQDEVFDYAVGRVSGTSDGREGLLQTLAKYFRDFKDFWSDKTYWPYRAAVEQVRQYNYLLGVISLIYLSLSKATNTEINLCIQNTLSKDKVLADLVPKPVLDLWAKPADGKTPVSQAGQTAYREGWPMYEDQPYMFFDFRKDDRTPNASLNTAGNMSTIDRVWLISPKQDPRYGWPDDRALEDYVPSLQDPSLRKLGKWSLPLKSEIENSFFIPIKDLKKESRQLKAYISSCGGPTEGLFGRAESKDKKSNFNIWLEDTPTYQGISETARGWRTTRTYVYRLYARLDIRDFRNSDSFSCGRDACPNNKAAQNSKYVNRIYPVLRDAKIDSYLPWRVFDNIKKETKNFSVEGRLAYFNSRQ